MTANSIGIAAALIWSCAPGPRPVAAQSPVGVASLADTVALGAFLDGIINTQMEQFTIPSAAVLPEGPETEEGIGEVEPTLVRERTEDVE